MQKPVYFISDIHLGLESKEKERKKEAALVSLLNSFRGTADELYIVGDLFDYWFEYRRVYQKGYFKTLSALAGLTESGVKLHYVIGNHDFMHRDFFVSEIGAALYESGFECTLQGKKFFIAHGDGLVANDLGYRILKKVLRNKTVQNLYALIHPDTGIALASHSSKSSRQYTSKKDYGEQDSMFQAAKKHIDNGCEYVIFGHSHRKDFKEYGGGYYVNLGSWLEQPCYGELKDGSFKIIDWNYNE